MSATIMPVEQSVPCGEGLLLRPARPEDADALVEFNTRIFDERITGWTEDLVSGRHPNVRMSDFTVVEDVRANRIVSSVCLISQTWRYGDIAFRVGRPDLVATDPEYRRRGLVRKQFAAIHARSEAKGELMQVIAGVDWFYRQFGYEMGANLWGSRCVDAFHLAGPAAGDGDGCRLRAAGPMDYEFIRDLYERNSRGLLYSAVRTDDEWALEFGGRSKGNTRRRDWLVIEDAAGGRLGYVQYLPCIALPQSPMFRIYQIELVSGASYLNLATRLLARLWECATAKVADGELACEGLLGLELALEREHPFFKAMPQHLARASKPGAWYVRVPDMIAFLRRIRPALEGHLVGTLAEGYSGELKLNFYRSGIRIGFEKGRITGVEDWLPGELWEGDARLPDATFLRLVCGWHRFHELTGCFADCSGSQEAAVLLDALFPCFLGKVWLLA